MTKITNVVEKKIHAITKQIARMEAKEDISSFTLDELKLMLIELESNE